MKIVEGELQSRSKVVIFGENPSVKSGQIIKIQPTGAIIRLGKMLSLNVSERLFACTPNIGNKRREY